MLLTPHTFVGIAIATVVKQPLLAVPLSFCMHFVGDLVPHWDIFSNAPTVAERIKGWRILGVMGDLVLGVAVGLTFTLYALWVLNDVYLALSMFLCGIASVLPDLIGAPTMYTQKKFKISEAMSNFQGKLQFQAPLPWGMISQIIVIILCIAIISFELSLI